MKEQGASTTDVMLVTGHKNPNSVHRYERKRRDEDLRVISKKLTMATTSQTDDSENKETSITNITQQCSTSQCVDHFNLKISNYAHSTKERFEKGQSQKNDNRT